MASKCKTLSGVDRSAETVREWSKAVHRKPTMKDVARLAGVGTMTVSRVLSGRGCLTGDSAARANRRWTIAVPSNVLARAFRGQETRSIGLIIPYLYDPFFANCAHA